MAGTSYRMFIHPAFGSEKCKVCFRFWHVRDNDVSTACNLKLVNHTTKVEPKISLQIFENTKAIKEGEELVYHRKVVTHAAPKEGKQQHHMQPLLEERSAKKQRHAEWTSIVDDLMYSYNFEILNVAHLCSDAEPFVRSGVRIVKMLVCAYSKTASFMAKFDYIDRKTENTSRDDARLALHSQLRESQIKYIF